MQITRVLLASVCVVGGWSGGAGAWQAELKGGRWANELRGLAVDGAGDVFATGYLHNRFAVIKLSGSSGATVWHSRFTGAARALALDPTGNALAAGITWNSPYDFEADFTVAKFAGGNGGSLWRREISDGVAYTIATDATGDVVAGGIIDEAGTVSHVTKLSGATGADIWRSNIGDTASGGTCASLAVDGVGDIVAAGNSFDGDYDFLVVKLSGSTGAELWRYEIDGGANALDFANAVALDGAGDVLAAGRLQTAPGIFAFTVVKLSGITGAELWRQELSGNVAGDAFAVDVTHDSVGNAIAVGAMENMGTSSDFAVVKLAAATGTEIWRQMIDGWVSPYDEAAAVAVDASGDVVATGRIGDFISSAFFFSIVKLGGATGVELWRQPLPGRGGPGIGYSEGAAVAVDADANVVAGGLMYISTGPAYRPLTVVKLSGAEGADVIAGRKLLVTDVAGDPTGRNVVLQAKIGIGASPDSPADPRIGGATLEVRNPTTGESAAFALPAGNWQGLGNPPGQKGYKYGDAVLSAGPCRYVTIVANRALKASCRGDQIGFSLDEASQGSLALRLTTGSGTSARRYCMLFGGTVLQDTSTATGAGKFLAQDAPAPVTCPFP